MLIYSATVSVTGLLYTDNGYMGTVYGIVAASIIHGMGERGVIYLRCNHTTTCLTKSHAR